MPTHRQRWKLRDVLRLVAVAAIVAVVGVVVGRELEHNGQAAATLEHKSVEPDDTNTTAVTDVADEMQNANPEASEPVAGTIKVDEKSARSEATANNLTLTLSAPDICETDYGFQGWRIGETPVTWKVTDGKGPYTLEIDGEIRDGSGPYIGQTGTASVSCALQTGEVHYEDRGDKPYRYLRGAYVIDSGLKTIRATVTDGNGVTATATANVYVISTAGTNDHLLRRGHTYRVFGRHLLTVPENVDFRIGEESTDGTISLYIEGTGYGAVLWLEQDTFKEVHRRLPLADDSLTAAKFNNIDLNAKLDELIESLNQLPSTTALTP